VFSLFEQALFYLYKTAKNYYFDWSVNIKTQGSKRHQKTITQIVFIAKHRHSLLCGINRSAIFKASPIVPQIGFTRELTIIATV
jgi:hypothetical protein